jgi:hypothetical protein
MRIRLVLAFFAFSGAAQASSSYRVGKELLTAGDSAARAIELLGIPSYKSRRIDSHRSDGGAIAVVAIAVVMRISRWSA